MGEDGFYDELGHPPGHGDGWVPGYSEDPNVYALRVRGDSMAPTIKHGQFVVVEPNSELVPGEPVVVGLRDGSKMVKELQYRRGDSISLLSINGGRARTVMLEEIEFIHPVVSIVQASRWRQE
jgi:phage repressor protein C with HTH and peptisase S24 domain